VPITYGNDVLPDPANRPRLLSLTRGELATWFKRPKHVGRSARITMAHRIQWAGTFQGWGLPPPAQPICS
jgi:hypothetical protein